MCCSCFANHFQSCVNINMLFDGNTWHHTCHVEINIERTLAVWSWLFKLFIVNSYQETSVIKNPDSKFHGAHLGPTGPRWAPCWPHELCCLGSICLTHWSLWDLDWYYKKSNFNPVRWLVYSNFMKISTGECHELYRLYVNIVSDKGVVPPGNKALPEVMLIQFCVAIWRW